MKTSLILTTSLLVSLQVILGSDILNESLDSPNPFIEHFNLREGEGSDILSEPENSPNPFSEQFVRTVEENFWEDNVYEQTHRKKRDIRNDILENELRSVVNSFNSQISSLSTSAISSIISQASNLNSLQNWIKLGDRRLASNGLNDLNRIASRLPISIQNCYNAYGFTFSDVIVVATSKSSQCLSDKVNQGKSIVQDFRNSIANAVANVQDVSQFLAQCQILADIYPNVAGLVAKASCISSAILSIRSETVLLPLKIATIVGQAFNAITTIQSDMQKCGLEIVNSILDQSIESAKAINSCINQQNGVTTTVAPSISTTTAFAFSG